MSNSNQDELQKYLVKKAKQAQTDSSMLTPDLDDKKL